MLYSMGSVAGVNPEETQKEIREKISWSPWWFLRPSRMFIYRIAMRAKKLSGQPVSFTDFFGHFIGENLLGEVRGEEHDQTLVYCLLSISSLVGPLAVFYRGATRNEMFSHCSRPVLFSSFPPSESLEQATDMFKNRMYRSGMCLLPGGK